MEVREDVINGRELENWLFSAYELTRGPGIHLYLKREKFRLEHKAYYMIGGLQEADVRLKHKSVKKRHAFIIHDLILGPCIIDISEGRVAVNGNLIRFCIAAPINTNDEITIGKYRRPLEVYLNTHEIERSINSRKR